jgi:hypothetical protein
MFARSRIKRDKEDCAGPQSGGDGIVAKSAGESETCHALHLDGGDVGDFRNSADTDIGYDVRFRRCAGAGKEESR